MLFSFLVVGCAEYSATAPVDGTVPAEQQKAPEKGRVVFVMTDAAANMNSVTSVKVTVDSIKVHSAAKGWIEVSSADRTYDLLQLKAQGQSELIADVQLDEDTYNQIRLEISKVVVTDAQGEHEAKLPSGELKINGNIVVEANSTATATFDFVADESLHVTGKGNYIMAPVIQLETKEDADVEIKSNNRVDIKGGKVNTNAKVGMDADGNVGVGVKIPADAEIMIEDGKVKIGAKLGIVTSATGKGKVVFAITDAAADMGAVTSVKVTVEGLMVHSDAEGWVNLSTAIQTFDLLELRAKGAQALIAAADLEPGTYNQVRLDISKVVVIDSSGEHEAKLPSNELKIVGMLVVNENLTSTAIFDFIANESLHVTGNGKYVMAPVVKLETREKSDVKVKSDKSLEIKGGKVNTSVKVGMDADGNVGIGREISKDSEISIEGNRVKIKAKVTIGY